MGQAWELSRFVRLTARSSLVILSLDFNAPCTSPAYLLQRNYTGLRDAWEEGHGDSEDGSTLGTIGNTWSSSEVPARIDYQFFSCGGDGGLASGPNEQDTGRWRLEKAWVVKLYTPHGPSRAALSVSDHFGVGAYYSYGEAVMYEPRVHVVRANLKVTGVRIEAFRSGSLLRTSLRQAVAKKLDAYASDVSIIDEQGLPAPPTEKQGGGVAVKIEIKSAASDKEAGSSVRSLNREVSSLGRFFEEFAEEEAGWKAHPRESVQA